MDDAAIIVAIITAIGVTVAQVTSSRATRAAAATAASVEHTKVDRAEHDAFVEALQAELARRAADADVARARQLGEEERNTVLRERLQSALDDTAAIQDELRVIRTRLRDVAADLVDERQLTVDLRDRLGELDVQVAQLLESLRQAEDD